MLRETELAPSDFIYPLFLVEGRGLRRPIPSMPGIYNLSIDSAVEECRQAKSLGVPAVILFGIPSHKDARGTGAYEKDGIIPRAISTIKNAIPELQVIADVCMCEYTDHGHCGVIADNEVNNDQTLPLLAQASVAYVQAGADIIAPSDMMDGRIGAIRKALDESHFESVPILSYASKYASGFYGPFRDAAQSTPQFGDRRGYQMDPANVREALKEVAQDLEEGADLVMVKPALPYLDVIWRVKEAVKVPVAAYNVSGEYSMVKAAAQNGWLDYSRVMMEVLVAIKRAGADLILTYHALDAAKLL
jgi:porphobilinogen synthase